MRIAADLRSALDRLTRPPLAGAAAALILVLLLVVIGLHLAGLEAPSGGRLDLGTGDFLAFWTGAVSIHDGTGTALYDFAAQKELQARILGGAAGGFQPYLNPPLLALLLSPLVPLGYVRAFYVFDLACVVALAAGILMLLRVVPTIRSQPGGTWTLAFLVASFQPMIQTTLGGQNTPITFALLAGLALAVRGGSALATAIVLGLLTYKPQYAIGAGVALALAGCWRAVAGGALLGMAHWLLGAWWCGLRWPLDMLAFFRAYRPLELADNAATHFSWVRTADFVLPAPLGAVAGAAGVVLVLASWWRFRDLGRRGDAAWLALVVCGTMLSSPHEQYYDSALLVLPVCMLIDRELARRGWVPLGTRILLAAAYAGYPLWDYAVVLRIQPLFVVLAGIEIWALLRCLEADREPSRTLCWPGGDGR